MSVVPETETRSGGEVILSAAAGVASDRPATANRITPRPSARRLFLGTPRVVAIITPWHPKAQAEAQASD